MGERYKSGFRCDLNCRFKNGEKLVCKHPCRYDETVFRKIGNGIVRIMKGGE